jgi:hypothetical protein
VCLWSELKLTGKGTLTRELTGRCIPVRGYTTSDVLLLKVNQEVCSPICSWRSSDELWSCVFRR